MLRGRHASWIEKAQSICEADQDQARSAWGWSGGRCCGFGACGAAALSGGGGRTW